MPKLTDLKDGDSCAYPHSFCETCAMDVCERGQADYHRERGHTVVGTTPAQAAAFHYLLAHAWSIPAAMAYVLAQPDFVKAIADGFPRALTEVERRGGADA